MRAPGDIVLVSCYEPGYQPIAIASPAAFLRAAGYAPVAIDLAVEELDGRAPRAAGARAAGRDLGADAHRDGAGAARRASRARDQPARAHLLLRSLRRAQSHAAAAPRAARGSTRGRSPTRSSAPSARRIWWRSRSALEAGAASASRPSAAAPAASPAVPGSRSHPAAAARSVRAPAGRRRTARRRPCRGDARLQVPVPPLPDPAGLSGALLRGPGRRRARGRAAPDRRRCAPHHLRRSRLPQQRQARAGRGARAARRAPRHHLQLHRQGRAHRGRARDLPRAGGAGMPVRRLGGRVAVRRDPRAARQGAHARRRRSRRWRSCAARGSRCVPRSSPSRRSRRSTTTSSSVASSARTISSRRSIRSSSRSVC